MSACAGCGEVCTWNGTEMVDPEDGAPHGLTCAALGRDRRYLGRRREPCASCRAVTEQVVVRDSRRELHTCLVCRRRRVVERVNGRGSGAPRARRH